MYEYTYVNLQATEEVTQLKSDVKAQQAKIDDVRQELVDLDKAEDKLKVRTYVHSTHAHAVYVHTYVKLSLTVCFQLHFVILISHAPTYLFSNTSYYHEVCNY